MTGPDRQTGTETGTEPHGGAGMGGQGGHRRNARLALVLGGVVAGMVGLSFAAVPLYSLFCKVTGFGGTTQVASTVSDRVLDRTVEVRFNADVNQGLPWAFRPAVSSMSVKLGQPATTVFHATNLSDKPIVGNAAYNVTPDKAGLYFSKIQCFCFTEQRLEPGQSVDMPVYFFVDPSLDDDAKMADVKTITLSYTFFMAPDQTAALAVRPAAGTDASAQAAHLDARPSMGRPN